jgi:ABC-type transport system substrate-binding protein
MRPFIFRRGRSIPFIFVVVLLILLVFSTPGITLFALSSKNTSFRVYPNLANFNTPVLSPGQVSYNQPYLRKIVFDWPYSSEEAIYEAMNSGQADIYSFTDPSIIKSAESNPDFNVSVVPTFGFYYLMFNFQKYPYNNTYFRRGIISLLDYSAIQSTVCNGGLTCTASPLFLLPELSPTFANPAAYQYYLEHESYNLTRAMLYFEKAGLVYSSADSKWLLPNGTAFQPTYIYYAGDVDAQDLAELLQTSAAKINMTINIVGEAKSTVLSLQSEPYNQMTWDMSYSDWLSLLPTVPVTFEYLYGSEGYPVENAGGFYNSTVFNTIDAAYYTSNYTESLALSKLAQVYLMQQLPYVMFDWIVTDTVVNTRSFAGYAVAPDTGISTIDVHPVGSALNGTFYEPGLANSAPTSMNIYSAEAASELGLLDEVYDTPLITNISNPSQLIPWVATSWNVVSNLNTTVPTGKLVNGEAITLNFARNVTWQDGVRLTAADYNFTLWYLDEAGISSGTYSLDGLQLNYTAESSRASAFYYDYAPGLVYSQVNSSDPYQITIYFNTSSYWNIYDLNSPILPMHIFDKTPPQSLYNAVYVDELGSGPYIWDGWNKQEALAEVVDNPSYWKFNPLVQWTNLSQGVPLTLSANVSTIVWNNQTQLFNYVPITNATAQMRIGYLSGSEARFLSGAPAVVPMTASGSVYTGTLNTADLSPGLYEVIVNATYTANGVPHEFLRFYSLTVTPSVATSTSTTASTAAVSTGASSPSPTVTSASTAVSTTASSVSTSLVVVIVLVVVVIVVAAVLALRRR